MMKSREVRLKRRPVGMPVAADFEIAEVDLPDPAPGQMLIRNVVMSVDPYMRGRMIDQKSYMTPFQLGVAMEGGAIGQVVKSNDGPYPVGAHLSHFLGWRDYAISDGVGMMPVDPQLAPLSSFLGTMGLTGLTAYVGFLQIADPKPGETVFVSAAAGAVGAIVCQIAKLKDCRVIGSAGSDDKVEWLKAEGVCDHAFNYKRAGDLTKALAAAAPEGIDIYFENVGGEHLVAALNCLKNFGRIAVCGMISQYNATEPSPGPPNLINILINRLTVKGFSAADHFDAMPQFMKDMSAWIAAGKVKSPETVVEGLEKSPEAFMGLFRGENMGKMIVRIGPDIM